MEAPSPAADDWAWLRGGGVPEPSVDTARAEDDAVPIRDHYQPAEAR
jgi:hypothetical protein